jgi:hypothetical protein
MTDRHDDEDRYTLELDLIQRERLDRYDEGWIDPFARYAFYRCKGHPPDAAFACALAWAINRTDQYTRDYAHDTGAQR